MQDEIMFIVEVLTFRGAGYEGVMASTGTEAKHKAGKKFGVIRTYNAFVDRNWKKVA